MVIENTPVEMMIGNLLDEELPDNNVTKNNVTDKVDAEKKTKVTDTMQAITLENECTIYEVAEKHQHIMESWQDQSQPLIIDLSKVTEIDSCFIQLLMSCKKTALEKKTECNFINSSEEVVEKIKGLFAENLLTQ